MWQKGKQQTLTLLPVSSQPGLHLSLLAMLSSILFRHFPTRQKPIVRSLQKSLVQPINHDATHIRRRSYQVLSPWSFFLPSSPSNALTTKGIHPVYRKVFTAESTIEYANPCYGLRAAKPLFPTLLFLRVNDFHFVKVQSANLEVFKMYEIQHTNPQDLLVFDETRVLATSNNMIKSRHHHALELDHVYGVSALPAELCLPSIHTVLVDPLT